MDRYRQEKSGVVELLKLRKFDRANPLFLIGLFSAILFIIGLVLGGNLLIFGAGFVIILYLVIIIVWVKAKI